MKKMRYFLAIGTILVCQNNLCFAGEVLYRKPNILVIVADDLGYADIGVHGSKDIPTPNIDALAKGGIRFTDAYVSGPYCSPTRAGLLTGKYPQRFGHEFIPYSANDHMHTGLPVSEITMADRLRTAGYRTALIGKWHLGLEEKFHPLSRGFDEFFGFLDGGHFYLKITNQPEKKHTLWMSIKEFFGFASPNVTRKYNPILHNKEVVAQTGYLTDNFADQATYFIQREKTEPFFLYLAFNAVHVPMQATDKYMARFPDIKDPKRRTYAAMLSAMDDAIGKTMATLREEGLEENTLVIFFNDNGGPVGTMSTANGSNNSPLRGAKRQTWEGGIRVPFIIRWKNHLPEGITDSRPIIQLDVLPTALAAAGVPIQPEWKLDGVNLLPYLQGENRGQPHEMLYWRLAQHVAIRKGDWKLVKTSALAPQDIDSHTFDYLKNAELYNLATDIGETSNLAEKYPEKVKELRADWLAWNKQLIQPLWPPKQE